MTAALKICMPWAESAKREDMELGYEALGIKVVTLPITMTLGIL
ncbi:hypothetical protein OK016_28305 [Vibrio chagasii]|nr:hypothetical protein [Vibrio chagasii]